MILWRRDSQILTWLPPMKPAVSSAKIPPYMRALT